jgi:hypothetical protein
MLCLKSRLGSSFSWLEKEPCINCITLATETLDSHAQAFLVRLCNITLFSYLKLFFLLSALAIGGAVVDTYNFIY